MFRRLLIPAFLFFCLGVLGAQTSRSEAAVANFDDGVQLLLDGKPKKAIKPLERAVGLDSSFTAARRLLGATYEVRQDYESALQHYLTILDRDPFFSRLLYFQTAELLYKVGRPRLALRYYGLFERLQERNLREFGLNGEEEATQEAAALERLFSRIEAAEVSSDSAEFINVGDLVLLDAPINSEEDDYFPFFSNDLESCLFTRLGTRMTKRGLARNEDLLRAERRGLENQKWAVSAFGGFNTKQPEGMCTLVRDGETIYFTLCHEETGQGGCDLYSGLLIDGRIRQVEALPDYINSPHWESQAAISCDGQQLFFASNRPGGLGGSDLYYCTKNNEGVWSRPKNLGPAVNTELDEEAPFLSNDGGTLFFASLGHNSLGDQDIFMSGWSRSEERWLQAVNLGPHINSPHREIGFHLTPDGSSGYLASDRPGGYGKLDIYRFDLNHRLAGDPVTFVSGFVRDSITGDPITDQAVPVGEEGRVYFTNYAGRFFVCAPADAVLPVAVDNEGYLPYQRRFAIPGWPNSEPYRVDLLLQREWTPRSVDPSPPPPAPVDTVRRRVKTTNMNLTVLFNFDDASLMLRQIENIDLFVQQIGNRQIKKVTISGYTDNTGTDQYNLELSQKRARAVSVHLKTAGLRSNNFIVRGLGEIIGAGKTELNRKVDIQVQVRELVEE